MYKPHALQFRHKLVQLPLMIALSLIVLSLITGAAASQETPEPAIEAAPRQTTATYGEWVLRCSHPDAKGNLCEIVTWVTARDANGNTSTILQIAMGQPEGSAAMRGILQVPLAVRLDAPITVLMNGSGESSHEGAAADKPEDSMAATYIRCAANGCLAEFPVDDDVLKRLADAGSLAIRFAMAGRPEAVAIPIATNGLNPAITALNRPVNAAQ